MASGVVSSILRSIKAAVEGQAIIAIGLVVADRCSYEVIVPLIELRLEIDAPQQRVFDLARSIDLHSCSVGNTDEKAIGGVTSGLIGSGEEVSWSARHLGIRQRLTSRITAFDAPRHFRDSMIRGAFSRLDHDHFFEALGSGTLMTDRFDFDSPGWVVGRLVNKLFLTDYLRRFLVHRNLFIKQAAETERWKKFLSPAAT